MGDPWDAAAYAMGGVLAGCWWHRDSLVVRTKPEYSFEKLAPHYRWLEFVLAGEKLQRCRTAFLTRDLKPEHILILGEGNGRFLVECRKVFSSARVVCVDASQTMLRLARRRLYRNGLDDQNLELIEADALSWVLQNNGLTCSSHISSWIVFEKTNCPAWYGVWLRRLAQAHDGCWRIFRSRTAGSSGGARRPFTV